MPIFTNRLIREAEMDEVFARNLVQSPAFATRFLEASDGRHAEGPLEVSRQTRHVQHGGTIDLDIKVGDRFRLLVENKIDARESYTSAGIAQRDRYRASAAGHALAGVPTLTILLCPEIFGGAGMGSGFDRMIHYEQLRGTLPPDDAELLERAIQQAKAPYVPVENEFNTGFFQHYEMLVANDYPALAFKAKRRDGGARPATSKTMYFDTGKTLGKLPWFTPTLRMSHQCLDETEPSASVKIMIGTWARHVDRLEAPQSLADIDGYIRRAGASLALAVDTPRLYVDRPFSDLVVDVRAGLEAAMRLARWWRGNPEVLRRWQEQVSGREPRG